MKPLLPFSFLYVFLLIPGVAGAEEARARLLVVDAEIELGGGEGGMTDLSGVGTVRVCEGVFSVTGDGCSRERDGVVQQFVRGEDGSLGIFREENRRCARVWRDAMPWMAAAGSDLRYKEAADSSVVLFLDREVIPHSGRWTMTVSEGGGFIFATGDTICRTYAVTCSTVTDSCDGGALLRSERRETRWYADGYAWPVVETVSVSVSDGSAADTVRAAYLCPPSEQGRDESIVYPVIPQSRGEASPRKPRRHSPEPGAALDFGTTGDGVGTPSVSARVFFGDGEVTVEFAGSSTAGAAVVLADAGGRVHASAERVGNSVSLATAHCPPGYYILSITVGAETRSVKFPVGL